MASAPHQICRACHRSRPASDFQHRRNQRQVYTCLQCRSVVRNRRIVRQSAPQLSPTAPYSLRTCSRCYGSKPETQFFSVYHGNFVRTCRSCRSGTATIIPRSSSPVSIPSDNSHPLSPLPSYPIQPIHNTDLSFPTSSYRIIYTTPTCSYCNQSMPATESIAADPAGLIRICQPCQPLAASLSSSFSYLSLPEDGTE